jgi:hypothetical protein
VGCSTAVPGGTLTYTFYDDYNIPGDSVTPFIPTTSNTATWTAPYPWWTNVLAHPSVDVCLTGTTICTGYSTTIEIIPLFSISGNVFVDQNKNKLKDTGEPNYTQDVTGDVSISPNPTGATKTAPATGAYKFSNLPVGEYTVTYTKPIALTNWIITYKTPAEFTVRVGNTNALPECNTNGNNAVCDNVSDTSTKGNIESLNIGISDSIPWIQSVGGDITGVNVTNPDGGALDNPIPSTAIEPYVSLPQPANGTPGIIYLGNSSSFNPGGGQASPYEPPDTDNSPPWNWVVTKDSNGYTVRSTQIITSYQSVDSLVRQSNISAPLITSITGCSNLSDCQLPSNIANGIYKANGNLSLTGPSYTFPSGKNFVVLVNGDLNINTQIHVPIGSTVLFSVSGNINVGSTVGTSASDKITTQVEGYYSADKNFTTGGTNGASCPDPDLRLNVAGSIVVNASLKGGSFTNQRDLCGGNISYPSFTISERADFILNAADLFKTQRRVWQEIAP